MQLRPRRRISQTIVARTVVIGIASAIKFSRYGTVKLPQGRQRVRECTALAAHKTWRWPRMAVVPICACRTAIHPCGGGGGRPSFYRTDMAMSYGDFLTGNYRRVIEVCARHKKRRKERLRTRGCESDASDHLSRLSLPYNHAAANLIYGSTLERVVRCNL